MASIGRGGAGASGSLEMVADGNSHYHALQVTVERRFSRSFSLLGFYSFSKSIDDESINAQFTLANPNPYDPRFNLAERYRLQLRGEPAARGSLR